MIRFCLRPLCPDWMHVCGSVYISPTVAVTINKHVTIRYKTITVFNRMSHTKIQSICCVHFIFFCSHSLRLRLCLLWVHVGRCVALCQTAICKQTAHTMKGDQRKKNSFHMIQWERTYAIADKYTTHDGICRRVQFKWQIYKRYRMAWQNCKTAKKNWIINFSLRIFLLFCDVVRSRRAGLCAHKNILNAVFAMIGWCEYSDVIVVDDGGGDNRQYYATSFSSHTHCEWRLP